MRYVNYILLAVFIIAGGYLLYQLGLDYYQSLQPKVVMMSLEVPGVKVSIDEGTSWTTIAQTIVAVLGSYFGVKLINKYIK